MSVDGCGPVRWGTWSVGGYKAKARRGKNGHAEHDSGPMAGEISPDISCLAKKQKKCTDDSGWVHVGADGCDGAQGHGGTGKQAEKRHILCERGHVVHVCSSHRKATK